MSHRKAVRRIAGAAPVAVALVIALVGAASVTQAGELDASPPSRAGLELAVANARASLSAAAGQIGITSEAVTAGADALASSRGHVLDETSRAALAEALATARSHLATAQASYLASQKALSGALTVPLSHDDMPLQLAGVRAVGELPTEDLKADADAVDAARAAVADAVEAWKAEQKRLAAEKAAREAAARAAAQERSQPASNGGGVALSSSGVIDVYVRGWVNVPDASAVPRAQAAVDAGGQIAIDYQQVGVVVVSAHNYFDSTALRLRYGDVVRFSGAIGGSYRVVSEIWVGAGSSVANLAALGTSVAMQTCGSSSMRVVGLSRIG